MDPSGLRLGTAMVFLRCQRAYHDFAHCSNAGTAFPRPSSLSAAVESGGWTCEPFDTAQAVRL